MPEGFYPSPQRWHNVLRRCTLMVGRVPNGSPLFVCNNLCSIASILGIEPVRGTATHKIREKVAGGRAVNLLQPDQSVITISKPCVKKIQ